MSNPAEIRTDHINTHQSNTKQLLKQGVYTSKVNRDIGSAFEIQLLHQQ